MSKIQKIDGRICDWIGHKIPRKMNTLEHQLNSAIEAHGFRISPRLPFRDRLARYIELYTELDVQESDAVAGMMMMRHSGQGESLRVTITNPNAEDRRYPQRTRRATTVAPVNNGTHPMTRRSQSKAN
jgi:hypothetical protein